MNHKLQMISCQFIRKAQLPFIFYGLSIRESRTAAFKISSRSVWLTTYKSSNKLSYFVIKFPSSQTLTLGDQLQFLFFGKSLMGSSHRELHWTSNHLSPKKWRHIDALRMLFFSGILAKNHFQDPFTQSSNEVTSLKLHEAHSAAELALKIANLVHFTF